MGEEVAGGENGKTRLNASQWELMALKIMTGLSRGQIRHEEKEESRWGEEKIID
jgi:hypothetical protein